MEPIHRAIAIVGAGAILPDSPNVAAFWSNIKDGRYSITDVPRDRWDPELHYDPDPAAPDKTYSKIGGWVREYSWDPMKWHLPLPPRVTAAMDEAQRWAIACTRQALDDYGYPNRPLDTGSDRGHSRQCHGRGETLPHGISRLLPGIHSRTGAHLELCRATTSSARRYHPAVA